MKQQLDVSNCLGVRALADTHSLIDLKRIADEYAKEHFEEVIKGDEFFQLPTTPQQLIDLISSDELNIHSEGRVFNAVMAWIRLDEQQRRPFISRVCCNLPHFPHIFVHFFQILKHVRLHFCSSKFLSDIVSGDEMVKNENECRKLVAEARNYQILSPHYRSSTVQYSNLRKYGQVLYAGEQYIILVVP